MPQSDQGGLRVNHRYPEARAGKPKEITPIAVSDEVIAYSEWKQYQAQVECDSDTAEHPRQEGEGRPVLAGPSLLAVEAG